MYNGVQIYFENGFVNAFLNQGNNLLKMIFSGTFNQNNFVIEFSPYSRQNE
jgi:hypothetical protein